MLCVVGRARGDAAGKAVGPLPIRERMTDEQGIIPAPGKPAAEVQL
jgi:hypothetical protein